jgi:5-dehydro-2-deoxygluconokinase
VIEALVVGRVGVDLTPTTPRTTLATADSFTRAVGGFAGNIGVGLARLGVRTAILSAVGDDGHGDHVRGFLAEEGIDVASLVTRPGSRTQVAFFEAWPPDRFPVTFYRSAPAPETQLTVADLPTRLLEEAPLVIVSGALFADEPARSMVLTILEDRRKSRDRRLGSITLVDLDWRPTLWNDPAEAPAFMERAARLSDVLIGSDEEFAAVTLRPEPGSDGGPDIIVLKHGPDGVSLVTDSARHSVPGIAVDVLCGIGAGDALTAAFAAGLIRGLDPLAAVDRGNAAGAIVATRLMCSTAMPTPDVIDRMLAPVSVPPLGALP